MSDTVGGIGEPAEAGEPEPAQASPEVTAPEPEPEAAALPAAPELAPETVAALAPAPELEIVPAPPKRRHRVRNSILGAVSVIVVIAVGLTVAAAYDVHKLTANLKHTVLLPPGFSQPPEPVDAYGNSAMNILLIGSDTRDTSTDASLGGDAGPGANADSEMIVHLSADRTNATVLSIPRDTVTELPQCAGGGEGMINSALQYGADCQVAAAHLLTGLTIDHYIMFDFSGVVAMSQEIGGVPVCVTANVKDPNSGLVLYKGTTNIQGNQALEFLRTRDAFYDGSDIGRERATHYFFSQLIQQMKASASFTNIAELQGLAEAVTKATTVDNGLDSVTALIGLGEDLNKVPTDRITFLIMHWGQDPNDPNRVVPTQPDADNVFAAMLADQPFTTSGGAPAPLRTGSPNAGNGSNGGSGSVSAGASPSASPSGTGTPVPASPTDPLAAAATESSEALAHPMHVNVVNASGTTGRAETITQQVFADGFVYVSGSDATTTTITSTLSYEPSEAAAAKELATALGLPASALLPTATTSAMTLTIGTDWSAGVTYPALAPTTSDTPTGSATSLPSDSFMQNAAATGGCITANPDDEF